MYVKKTGELLERRIGSTFYKLTLYAPTPQSGQATQTICLQQTMNCLSVFDHFVGLRLKGSMVL